MCTRRPSSVRCRTVRPIGPPPPCPKPDRLPDHTYDQAAVDCYVLAWEVAERMNRTVRLPEFTPTSATRRNAGEDLSVLRTVSAEQRSTVTSSPGPDGRPVPTVTVGAVTIDVHSTTALRCHLAAWCKSAAVTGMLEDTRDEQ